MTTLAKKRVLNVRHRLVRYPALAVAVTLGAAVACGRGDAPPFSRGASHVPPVSSAALLAEATNIPLPLLPTETTDAGIADGTTDGQFWVSFDGQANYSVSIWAPPGRSGIEPHLVLRYQSRAGDGPEGVGWTLEGLMSITRCAHEPSADALSRRPVAFDGSDRLCFGGKRLVLINGAYFADGAEYRTEEDSFAKVFQHGAPPNDAAIYFTIYLKSGEIVTLGDGSGANGVITGQIKGPGALQPAVYGWLQTRLEDRSGNYLTASYETLTYGDGVNSSASETLPTLIQYTGGNQGLTPQRSVSLSYVDRPDPSFPFVSGMQFASKRILRQVVASGPGVTRQYTLTYNFDTPQVPKTFTERTLLTAIQECSAVAELACKSATTFTYEHGFGPNSPYTTVVSPDIENQGDNVILDAIALDANGDGLGDLLTLHKKPSTLVLEWRLRLGSRTGLQASFPVTGLPLYPYYSTTADVRPINIKGSGPDQLVVLSKNSDGTTRSDDIYQLFTPNGSTFIPVWSGGHDWTPHESPGLVQEKAAVLDADGDGLPELAVWSESQTTFAAYYPNQGGSLANGSAWVPYSPVATPFPLVPRVAHLSDASTVLLGRKSSSTQLVTMSGTVLPDVSLSTQDDSAYALLDLNGDGYTDVFSAQPPNPVSRPPILWLTSGANRSVRATIDTTQSPLNVDTPQFVVDFDQDGTPELVGRDSVTGYVGIVRVQQFAPDKFGWKTLNLLGASNTSVLAFVDANGDGLPDIVTQQDGVTLYRYRSDRPADLLTNVQDGLGATVRVDYKPVSDPSVYTASVDLTYPLARLKRALWVVAATHWSTAAAAGYPTERDVTYSYEDGAIDLSYRGFLGFSRFTVIDMASGLHTDYRFDNTTRFGTAYPYAGTPNQAVVFGLIGPSGPGVHYIESDWTMAVSQSTTNGPYFVYAQSADISEGEGLFNPVLFNAGVRPTPFRTSHHVTTFDGYGNILTNDVTIGDGFAEHADFSYGSEDIANWLVGRPTLIRAKSTAPDGTTVTRTTQLAYAPGTDLLQTVTREPAATDPSLTLTRTFIRADPKNTGQVSQVDESPGVGVARSSMVGYDAEEAMFPVSVTDALGQTTSYAYVSAMGLVTAAQVGTGPIVYSQYDYFGRPRGGVLSDLDGAHRAGAWTRSYLFGQVVYAPLGGARETTVYDVLGRPYKTTREMFNGQLSTASAEFDDAGRLRAAVDWAFAGDRTSTTRFNYERFGRIELMTNPDGSARQRQYSGMQVTSIDEIGRTSYVLYTQSGDVAKQVNVNGGDIATEYGYGPFHLVTKVTDSASNIRRIIYDVQGRTAQMSDPDTGVTSYQYNSFDEPLSEQRADGSVTSYTYDAAGRLLTESSTQDGVSTLTWSSGSAGDGTLTDARSGDDVLLHWTRDTLGRPTQVDQTVAGVMLSFNRSYDALGRPQDLTYPAAVSGERLVVRAQYDSSGYLASLVNPTTSLAYYAVTAGDAHGRAKTETRGPDATGGTLFTVDRRWDPRNRPTFLKAALSSGQVLQQMSYEYFPDGNLKAQHDLVAHTDEDYLYDAFNRLTSWTVSQGCRTPVETKWSYDDLGNLTRHWTPNVSGLDVQLFYAEGGKGPHVLTHSTLGAYSNDAVGNQVSAPGRSFNTMTAFGLPKQATVGSQSLSFLYDAFHSRASKTVGGDNGRYFGGLFRIETQGSTQRRVHSIAAGGELVAEIAWVETGGSIISRTVQHLVNDRMGSPEVVLDGFGTVLETRKRDPFGALRLPSDLTQPAVGALSTVLDFTGQRQDSDLSLLDYGGRLYDAQVSHFVSADPITDIGSGQALNPYSYVRNNPTGYTDPSGFLMVCLPSCPGSPGGPEGGPAAPGPGGPPGGNPGGPPGNGGRPPTSPGTPTSANPQNWNRIDDGRPRNGPHKAYAPPPSSPSSNYGSPRTLPPGSPHPPLPAGVKQRPAPYADGSAASATAYTGTADFLSNVKNWVQQTWSDYQTWHQANTPYITLYDGTIIQISIGVAPLVPGMIPETLNPTYCLPPGTKVLMADGSEKSIEQIEEGDEVWTDDPETEELPGPHKVTQLYRNWTLRLIHIGVDTDGDGYVDAEIKATGAHPFWTRNRGWVDAKDLKAGDLFESGSNAMPVVVSADSIETTSETYNLTVDGTHTFFALAGDMPVLVHNADPILPFEVRPYADFAKFPGDGLEGHELLQNGWLRAHGYGTFRGLNPSLALDRDFHRSTVNPLQASAGLWSPAILAEQSAYENIRAGIGVLKEAGVPRSVIARNAWDVRSFAKSLPPCP
jgi:RHS repeat-associated protein